MKSIFATLVLCAVYLSSSVVADGAKRSLKICPIKGQQFPAPTLLSEDPGFQNATRTIEDFIRANLTQSPFNETTFSMGIFSADQEGLIYEYHHADAKLKNSTIGATTVDADSIYRIGSISKIFTVYLWLITQGDRKFSDPISEHIPQLLEINREQHDYVLPDWTEITVGDLASYLAGIARDYGLNDVAMPNYVTSLLPAMVSDLSVETLQREVPVCGFMTSNRTYNTCSQDIYIRGIQDLAASFPTAYTPSYSNANYALLGIALSNIVGASMDEIFNSSLARPLGLTATTPGNPRTITDKSVIPGGDEIKSGWQDVLGPLDAAAGVFSSINDLARLGRSILNHDLLSSAVTRRWYNSMSFVDHTSQAIGRGWEVFRLDGAGHTVDVYTKSGYWGIYTSFFAIVPEYQMGFTVLTASVNATGGVKNVLPNEIMNRLLPLLADISQEQAARNFAGHYTLANSNSSVTLTTDDQPGLKVSEYISNGVDIIDTVFGLFGNDIDFRLVPSHLYGKGKVGFTGVYQPPAKPLPDGTWYWPCQTWLDIDDFTLGSVPLGEFVFDVDDTGAACSVELKALRQTLNRKQLWFLQDLCDER